MSIERELLFVTGNSGKLTSIRKYLPEGYAVEQCKIPLVEPQADTVAEVSIAKAQLAYEKLGKALIVNDSGFCIDALNGFPGPYTKYVIDTIGVNGLVSIVKDKENRGCRFVQALTYTDDEGNMTTFTEDSERGKIAESVDPYEHPDDWSGLWSIYVPDDYDITMNHIIGGPEEKTFRDRRRDKAVFGQLAKWLVENREQEDSVTR